MLGDENFCGFMIFFLKLFKALFNGFNDLSLFTQTFTIEMRNIIYDI